jgi:hypothetical protein
MERNDLLSLFSTYRFLLDVPAAQEYLQALDSSLDLLRLYQETFAVEFQQDEQQAIQEEVSLFPPDGHSYSQCEVHFFDLVNQRLFPLSLDYYLNGLSDPYGERRLAYWIPVEPFGFEGDEYADLSAGWQLLLYLMGVVDQDFLRNHCELADDDLLALPVKWQDVSSTLVILRCEAQGGPLAYLYLALQMLQNDTESVWLNATFGISVPGCLLV